MLDPGTKFPDNHVHLPDHLDPTGAMNYGVRARKTAENYANYRSWNTNTGAFEEVESGVSTPPLWRSMSPPRSPQHRQNNYRCLSPSSRTQAIARGQRELMDMVSRMPEGCYELSLKDLVEVKQESFGKDWSLNNGSDSYRREQGRKENGKKAQINRSGSMDNGGFLLKMVFPISWSSRKKKRNNNNSSTNNCSKDGRLSPKPLLSEGSEKSTVDQEWWKNRFSISGESESGVLSSNSGSSKSSGSTSSRSSSRSSSRPKSGGCFSSIFLFKKGKRKE